MNECTTKLSSLCQYFNFQKKAVFEVKGNVQHIFLNERFVRVVALLKCESIFKKKLLGRNNLASN